MQSRHNMPLAPFNIYDYIWQMKTQTRAINLLPPELRNQIAAGEVVERPASVLKELVENALDAGATQIYIHLENGGQGCIKVQDNGHGIAAHELELAVTRHATSKIQNLDDLLSIYSYGFRGEALPSIASVARFSITSCHTPNNSQPSNLAQCLQIEFGQIKSSTPAALTRGTVIEVRDLFSNIPARLKFLKSTNTENKKAQEWLVRLAIAKTHVGFNLNIGGRETLNLAPQQSLVQRLSELWPPLIMDGMRNIDNTHNGIRVHGMAALPHISQPRADRMLFYVNGRSIQDKTISAAVREAYKGRLTTKDYPQAVIFIEIDPEEIDINVHPAKTEIRFRDTSNLFSAVRRSIHNMLEAMQVAPLETTFSNQGEQEPLHNKQEDLFNTRPQGFWGRLDEESIISSKKIPIPNSDPTHTEILYDETKSFSNTSSMSGLNEDTASFDICAQSSIRYENNYDNAAHTHIDNAQIKQQTPFVNNELDKFKYLGQIDNTYLLLKDNSDTLLILDQHAIHERILFTRMQADALQGTGQLLALPLELSLHDSEIERAMTLRPYLEKLGFALQLEVQNLSISAIPPALERNEAKDFLRSALAGRKDDLDMLFISFACKASIKAGQQLTTDEAMELINQWLNTPMRDFCPHGRPCVLRFSSHDLEKLFKRK